MRTEPINMTLRLQRGPLAGRLCIAERVNGDYNSINILNEDDDETRRDNHASTTQHLGTHVPTRRRGGGPGDTVKGTPRSSPAEPRLLSKA